jgi:hypothetical protein
MIMIFFIFHLKNSGAECPGISVVILEILPSPEMILCIAQRHYIKMTDDRALST